MNNFSPSFSNDTMQNNYRSSNNRNDQSLDNAKFYSKVMAWVAGSFAAATVGALLIGPMVPPALMMPLYIVTFIALMAMGFVRKIQGLSEVAAIVIPMILGVILYPTLNYYISTGLGNVVGMAVGGTAVIFGAMSILGWISNKNLNNLASKLFFVFIGLIALSFLNAFVFKMSAIALLISVAVIAITCIYTFVDIQALKNRSPYDSIPASQYALNLFLNIYNIFVSLLNILGILRN